MHALWDTIDLAILGIGNTEVLELFGKTFGYHEKQSEAIGDIATHFFTSEGTVLDLYNDTFMSFLGRHFNHIFVFHLFSLHSFAYNKVGMFLNQYSGIAPQTDINPLYVRIMN